MARKRRRILIMLWIGLVFPNLGFADCTDLNHMTSWVIQDERTILFYSRNTPLATIVLDDCTLNSNADIRLLKNYICDGDKILVDGQACTIISVSLAASE